MIKNINRILFVLGLTGLLISMYLSYTKIYGAPPQCLVASGCDIVQSSEYAYFGGIPVPFWGVVFYLTVLLVVLVRTAKNIPLLWVNRFLILFLMWGVIFSAYLTYIELFVIYAICEYCVLSAIVSLALFLIVMYEFYVKREKINDEFNN